MPILGMYTLLVMIKYRKAERIEWFEWSLEGAIAYPVRPNKDVSKHILPASSNPFGICLVILNFVNLWKIGRVEKVVIDKIVEVSMFLILIASVMSYVPMRSQMKSDAQKTRILFYS